MGYPVQLVKLDLSPVLVVGGGAIAAQKLEGLLAAGARVHLVATEILEPVRPHLARVERVDVRPVVETDVEGKALVIAATSSREHNAEVSAWARRRGILANAVDDPEACTFFAPAVLRRGPICIAISTDGGSPLFAAQLRRLLEAALPDALDSVGAMFARLRGAGLRGLARRGKLLRALTDPMVTRLVDRGDLDLAEERLHAIADEDEELFEPGSVAIVGAGPGSKALLTLRALDRIQRADVILHDALVEPEVLALALPGTRVVDVGRRCASTTHHRGTSIELALSMLLAEARSGARVVRLHAGDPCVFGRGGEEIDALSEAGIPYEVVPGVSAVLAAPAAAGVPLTRRGEAVSFSVRTGHTVHGYTAEEPRRGEETVVVLMGLGGARQILAGLIAEGREPDTPAAVVSRATREGQRVLKGTLADLADRIEHESLEGPATIIVGRVAARALEMRSEKSSVAA